MYGVGKYGVLPYGSTSVDNDGGHGGGGGEQTPPEFSEYSDLMPFLPYYYQKSYEVKSLQKVLGQQILINKMFLQNIYEQFFIETATWGLDDIEKELGVVGNKNKNLKDRREYILAMIKGRGTTTVERVKNVGETFFGKGNIEVIEHPSECAFEVRVINDHAPQSHMKSLLSILDEIKPAHLVYDIDAEFNIWDDLSYTTWGGINDYTWREAKLIKNIGFLKEGIK